MATDYLQSDRKPVAGKTTWNGDRGKTGQGDGVRGAHPINVVFHFDAVDLSDPIRLDGKWRDLRHWKDQEFVLFHEFPRAMIKLRALCFSMRDVRSGQFQSLLDVPDDGVFHQRAMKIEIIASGMSEQPCSQRLKNLVGL